MDWISFFWGVGAIVLVNIVYTIWVYPKQLKRINELKNTYEIRVSKAESSILEYEENMLSIHKERDELELAIDRLESSIKLRKVCPACGAEFPLYIVEEEKVNG